MRVPLCPPPMATLPLIRCNVPRVMSGKSLLKETNPVILLMVTLTRVKAAERFKLDPLPVAKTTVPLLALKVALGFMVTLLLKLKAPLGALKVPPLKVKAAKSNEPLPAVKVPPL